MVLHLDEAELSVGQEAAHGGPHVGLEGGVIADSERVGEQVHRPRIDGAKVFAVDGVSSFSVQ